jgi:hypothetical protein
MLLLGTDNLPTMWTCSSSCMCRKTSFGKRRLNELDCHRATRAVGTVRSNKNELTDVCTFNDLSCCKRVKGLVRAVYDVTLQSDVSFDAFYMVHAAHMTCHTQYEYVGCEAGKRMVQLDRRGVQHLHAGQYESWETRKRVDAQRGRFHRMRVEEGWI